MKCKTGSTIFRDFHKKIKNVFLNYEIICKNGKFLNKIMLEKEQEILYTK
ncbi:hypothetical protein HMPREF1049_0408 [Fusobacterium necrophorum subsp. funduliforme ATCC 51357]|nr:hypothetical protein HMPREF1049_0408 [Fusobacterium necrophorum subsp. funduliforme ATCC 51357]